MTVENWRPVVGYEGLYEVSDQGRVRSFDRPRGCRGFVYKGRVLKHGYSKGYPRVNLYRDGVVRFALIHQLIMESFVGPCPDGQQVRHVDDDRLNCTLGNLLYGTHADNIEDSMRNARILKGESHWASLLTEADVIKIRALCTNQTQASVARRYGVNQSVISTIVNFKSWRHV